MKVLVAGYGSMGRRRIRLLRQIYPEIKIVCVDSNPERLEQIKNDGLEGYTDLKTAISKQPEIAFVCTSPEHHAEIILELVESGIHVFTELNLASTDYNKIIETAGKKGVIVFMSSTMLYDKRINYINEAVEKETQPLIYIYHVGQYLPDWHPWENYKDFFAGKKETNGVREIFAIQLPWIIDTFGPIESVSANGQKCTNMDIDYNDSIIASIKHKSGNIGVFIADIVSRKATTYLEVIGENIHIFWYGHNDDLFLFDMEEKRLKAVPIYDSIEHMEGYSDNIIENRYLDEIREFLRCVYKQGKPHYSLEKDAYTLSIIDRIEGMNG